MTEATACERRWGAGVLSKWSDRGRAHLRVHMRPAIWSGVRRLVSGALVLLFFSGCVTRPVARISLEGLAISPREQAQRNLHVFDVVWDLVNRKHYDVNLGGLDWQEAAAVHGEAAAMASDERALYRVLNALLAPLGDSHTHAITPAQVVERRNRERARTGFYLTRVEDAWSVQDVLPGSPAAMAGVQAGWLAVARNGEPLGVQIDFNPADGEVALWDFLDGYNAPIRLALAAKRLPTVAQQVFKRLADGFIYLRFDEFSGVDRRWLSRQLSEHYGAPGVVIDLRRNSGGETFSLGISVGEFFDHPVDCGAFIGRDHVRRVKNSWQLGSANYRGQVVILVDGATGSAAEIFAAVLQYHGRAVVVGRRTAGAVLASWFHRLPDGGQLQLSREDYVAPSGHRLEGRGVEPDVVVARSLDDLRNGRDRDLQEALRILRER